MKRKPITNELINGKDGEAGPNVWVPKILQLMEDHNIELPGVQELITHYNDNAAPASGGHHNNCIWGLWEHIYNVIWWSLELNNRLDEPYPNAVVFKVALCHDLSKFDDAPHPAPLKRDGNIRDKFWEYDNSNVYEGHEDYSLILGMKYFSFDRVDRNAIKYHMGPYSNDMKTDQYLKKDVMSGLAYLLFISDMIASAIVEPTFFAEKSIYKGG